MLYLIHFNSKLSHAGHYLGYTKSLKKRIQEHERGTGARIMQVVREQGISWFVSRTWSDGTRTDERKLKNRKNSPKLCPLCNKKLKTKLTKKKKLV